MILPPDEERATRDAEVPWSRRRRLEGLALAVVHATGPDPSRDGVFRLQALRHRGDGWERFDRVCRPFASGAAASGDAAAASRRMALEFGITQRELADAPAAESAWDELRAFVGEAPLVVPEREAYDAWAASADAPRASLGADELRQLLLPGTGGALSAAAGPDDVLASMRASVERFVALGDAAVALAAHGYAGAWRLLVHAHPGAADALALALTLVDFPDDWVPDGDLFAQAQAARALSGALERWPEPGAALDAALPACARGEQAWREQEPLPPDRAQVAPLDADDLRRVDEIFEVHLPAYFAERERDGARTHRLGQHRLGQHRLGQHRVAREVARSLGRDELLLVHAPTGTGKTLAYLVPACLFALRNELRVGVSTYTRALQDQAIRREAPVAVEMLRRAGVATPVRTTPLKGRANYLCWRALALHVPQDGDTAIYRLAWTRLALFALADSHADLDRFPRRSDLPGLPADELDRELARLVRHARAESGCCATADDRRTCGAHVARRLAERSHVVVTNHSLVLARRELFRHVLFDECEHLHDSAHEAWSHAFDPGAARELLGRVHRAPRGGRASSLLARVQAATIAAGSADEAVAAHARARAALTELEIGVRDFETWREDAERDRSERDTHALLAEYLRTREAAPLLDAHARLARALDVLVAALSELAEHLEELAVPGRRRLRRSLDLVRVELAEALEAAEAWIPRGERDEPALRRDVFFYDVEHDGARRSLVARVLLPHEFLGRSYHPELASGAFLSATTFLGGGFDRASRYLGLYRAAHPAEDEDRPPRALRTFRAPDVFDWSRVVVCAPRDAPQVNDKSAFLAYVRRFVAHLGERTRGRMLVLFTNATDCRQVGAGLADFFRERRLPFWYQRMAGSRKEELGERFRAQTDSILLGLDTFWYGADFPGETLEYLVLVRLPYGVPDRYHHAQCAALGPSEHKSAIYMPRALAKFRQGFGRLMRKESDRGCVFLLDGRVHDPRHRGFLRELPLAGALDGALEVGSAGARFVRGDTDRCLRESLAHMGMLADVARRGLDAPFAETRDPASRERDLEERGELPF